MGNERNTISLFENSTIYTREVYSEFCYVAGGFKELRLLYLLLAVVILILAGMIAGGAALADSLGDVIVPLSALGTVSLLLILFAFTFLHYIMTSQYRANCEIQGNDWAERMFFYEDYIFSSYECGTSKHGYNKIGRIVESKNLIILMLGSGKRTLRKGICINKTNFTRGDLENFKQFICHKTGLPIKQK